MAKRGAGNQLNHDNWEEEEDTEEAGIFKAAEQDVLKTRVIKKAKRKGVTSDPGGSGGAFKGFAGFTSFKSSTASTDSATFSAGGASAKPLFGSIFNGTPSLTSPTSSTPAASESSSLPTTSNVEITKTLSNGHSELSSRSKYVRRLKALNESVTQWIREHVEKNPYCILSPVFVDYNKYLDEINSKFPEEVKEMTEESTSKTDLAAEDSSKDTAATSVSALASTKSDVAASPLPKFTFGSKDATTSLASKDAAPSFGSKDAPLTFGSKGTAVSFGSKDVASKDTPISFGASSVQPPASSSPPSGGGFSFKSLGGGASTGLGAPPAFGSGTGFSFAVSKPKEESADSQGAGNADEEAYEPPKPEVSEVKEDDAFFTQKCKLFFKKDGGWQEKGVGHLHLKPCGEQTQLLIRADTSLGNILLNIKLTASLPASRQGKNNIALVCIPNPPLDDKQPATPSTLLIRLRTGDDADALLEEINKHK